MAAPILKIPVDDAAFKNFLDTFNKYQKGLESQPEMWKGVNAGIHEAVSAGRAFAESLAEQLDATKELATEEEKRNAALEQAAIDREKEDQKAKEREEAAAKRRKKAIDQVKEYAKSLATAAVEMGKWAVIDIGMGLGAAAIGGFGLKELGLHAGDQRKSAMGLGITPSEQAQANLTLGRYVNPNAALENIANLKQTPQGVARLNQMGINPAGKNSAAILTELSEKAAHELNRYPEQVRGMMAEVRGFTDVFSQGDLRTLVAAGKTGELHRQIQTGKSTFSNAGINDETGRKWQQFTENLDLINLQLKSQLANTLIQLGPSFTSLSKSISNLIIQVLTPANLKSIGDGIDKFALEINDKDFQTGLKNFAGGVILVGNVFAKIFSNKQLLAALGGAWAGARIGGPEGALVGAVAGSVGVTTPEEISDANKGQTPNWLYKWFHQNSPSKGAPSGDGNRPSKISAGEWNNNPGNIMEHGHLKNFATLAEGEAAERNLLSRKFNKNKLRSVYDIIDTPKVGWANEWSPGNTHQSTMNYIDYISKALGVKSHDPINLNDDTTMKNFMRAQREFEWGVGKRKLAGNDSVRGGTDVTITNHTGQAMAVVANGVARG